MELSMVAWMVGPKAVERVGQKVFWLDAQTVELTVDLKGRWLVAWKV